MTRTPAAVLWDFDGTLIDSEPLWQHTHARVAAELGGTWTPEIAAAMHGTSWPVAARVLLDGVGGAHLPIEYAIERWLQYVPDGLRAGVDWLPGARELLTGMRAADVPCALVSSSFRPILDAVTDDLPADTFATVIAGDDVTRGKPDPEPYLLAAAHLDVDPRDCLVIEDSGGGCDSGNAAGAVVLAVPSEHPVPAAPRRVQLPGLADVSWHDVLTTIAPAWEE
ncbi:MAG: HAD family phosphatase [Propionibacterium sp.]|nr:HAD family phosphatase [Propionibacterium sp.]